MLINSKQATKIKKINKNLVPDKYELNNVTIND